ncbi:hypothetical protein DFH08DRAFT_1089225 [Mycena albidolilacea]|uniref:Uncharacterized protein n=1 Tax=Mycena albidolilacea TaxID=1033008 RepID=A0AAD6Z1X2_9AGAR|nr:hypothetical protein DFH08DRAFT_1089225 [Mycena albidolilacea]
MRFALTLVFAALSTGLAAAVTPTTTGFQSLNPDPSVLEGQTDLGRRAPAPRPAAGLPLTNAKRLQRGFPLKKPAVRRHGDAHIAKRSGTPPVSYTANIQVTETGSGSVLGYVSSSMNAFGEYSLQDGQTGALSVTFSYQPEDVSAPLDVTINNVAYDGSPTFFGGIKGFGSASSDLVSGSSNYCFLGSTVQTPSGTGPTDGANSFTDKTRIAEQIESAIWHYDPATASLTPQWFNSDSSAPATTLVYMAGEQAFGFVGDFAAFTNSYGPTAGAVVTFTVVPAV